MSVPRFLLFGPFVMAAIMALLWALVFVNPSSPLLPFQVGCAVFTSAMFLITLTAYAITSLVVTRR